MAEPFCGCWTLTHLLRRLDLHSDGHLFSSLTTFQMFDGQHMAETVHRFKRLLDRFITFTSPWQLPRPQHIVETWHHQLTVELPHSFAFKSHRSESWAYSSCESGYISGHLSHRVIHHTGADFDVTQTSLTYGWGVLLRFQVQVRSLQTGQLSHRVDLIDVTQGTLHTAIRLTTHKGLQLC